MRVRLRPQATATVAVGLVLMYESKVIDFRDIPLPLLTRSDCEGGEADELTRGRLMLRAALETTYDH